MLRWVVVGIFHSISFIIMPYISAITIDFGSTNSGCARIELEQGKQSDYKLPIFLQGSQYYAKDDTWFFVSPSFWKRILKEYEKLSDEDFRIRSRVLPQTEQPTVIWGRQHIKANADMIEKEGWIGFRHFKMNLYHHEDYKIGAQRVPIKEVVRLFLRILKIECLAFEKDRRHRLVSREEIQWGVTIPTIWRDAEKALMTEVASDVFGNHVRILSEPEGPILSELLHSQGDGKFTLKLGRVSLVADLGGGTTDITLLEEVSEDPTCEYPLRVIASTDGVGVGGNNIDDAFWTYMLRLLSKGRKDDHDMEYDRLTDDELKECLLTPFVGHLKDYIEMEDCWLQFKHGESASLKFPSSYRKWLMNAGHNQIADYLTGLMIGDIRMDLSELRKKVFEPTFDLICGKIQSFLNENIDKIPRDRSLFIEIKGGGLSLSSDIRNRIDAIANGLNLKYTTNLSHDPVFTSGSIMDGACIVLLNRKIIHRKAPCNVYYDMNVTLVMLKEFYKKLGVNVSIGELNSIYEKEMERGAEIYEKAVPVAIMGDYCKDHESFFTPARENQDSIRFTFYGTEGKRIVLPHGNPDCFILATREFDTRHYTSFKLVIDFNETMNNNNFHYYITAEENGELLVEDNIPILPNPNNESQGLR